MAEPTPICLTYICTSCELPKPHHRYTSSCGKNRDGTKRPRRRRRRCLDCEAAAKRATYDSAKAVAKIRTLRETDPDRWEYLYGRTAYLRKTYGITPEEYDELRARQGYRCAICTRHEDELTGRWNRKLVVDHCHDSGAVRGLLCDRCNLVLGGIGDTEEALLRALAYIRRSAALGQTGTTG